jgi:hypothetical protein
LVTVKVMSARETPLAGPTWKRFGLPLQTGWVSVLVVSKATDLTDLEVSGSTASPK